MNILQGKKTIITGVLMIVIGSVSYLGINIPGMEVGNALEMIGTGFGLVFLRMGVNAGNSDK